MALPLMFGCGGPPRVEPPALDPEAVATRAMTELDRNHDGFLDARELESSPGLKSALKSLDTDHDGKLSKDELLDRLAEFQESRVGLFITTVKVVLDGKPAAGVTVDMEPEPFMGSSIKPAHGTTDDSGRATMRIDGEKLPGCQFGFYKVRLSKKDASGQEVIPARYANTLGAEVPKPSNGSLVFTLSSR
jgi:hypothetical protein